MTQPASDLDRRFGIPNKVRIADGNGGLTRVSVTTAAATGDLYLLGGQVTSWAPAGQPDVLFVSRASRWETGRAIRGGIPVCFPWFGNKVDDARAPAHGFVRSTLWTLEGVQETDAGIIVSVATRSDAETKTRWPFDFRLVLRALFGPQLRLDLVATNIGTAPLRLEEALHTYYAVGDAAAARVHGLEGTCYLDKVDGGRERAQQDAIGFVAETDRVYLDTSGSVTVEDPAMRRRLLVGKTNSRSTIVWNPWIDKARAMADLQDDDWTRMVCVETANVGPHAIALEPDQQHVMSLSVTVSAL